ncbi:MAG: DUF305 domain-containing protein [Nodosilinea sp.]
MASYRPFTLLLSLALVATAPALLGGCQTSAPTSADPEGHSMAKGDAPMTDHAMAMDLGPQDEDFDLRFIDGMILHHQGAVAMAETLKQQSQRPEMLQMADDIMIAQQGEIEQMQQWRQAWYPNADPEPMMYDAQMGHTMAMTADMQTEMMMSPDLGKADDEFDRRFLDAMIPHHEGALAMANEALAKSDRPEIRALADAIIATQQAEIGQMQQWRQSWYGQ